MAYGISSEQELLSQLRQGDRTAYAEIFERYYPLLYTHAYNKLRSREDAMDIVQDVFIKLWNRHQLLEEIPNFTGYLYTMLRNAVFSFLSRQKTLAGCVDQFILYQQDSLPETDHRIRESEFSKLIEQEIAALPPKMREVFELRRKEYLSSKEIAERLDISEQTVKDQMKKAKRQLRARLGMLFYLIYFI